MVADPAEELEYKFERASDKVAAEITKAFEDRKQLFAERDDVAHKIRAMRLMRHDVTVPRNWGKRHGPKPRLSIMYRLVQTAVTSVYKEMPHVQEEALDVDDKPFADDSSRAWNLGLQTIDRMHHMRFLINAAYKHYGDGLSVTKVADGAWGGYPGRYEDESDEDYDGRCELFKREHPLPFHAMLVDPLTFYPPEDEYGEQADIEISWRPTRDVFRQMGVLPTKGKGAKPIPLGHPYPMDEFPAALPTMTEWREGWTKDSCWVKCEKLEGIWIAENPLGFRPHSYAFADPTGVDNPTNAGMSVAFPLYTLQPHMESILALWRMWAMFMAPTLFSTQQASPYVRPTQEMAVMGFEPGMIYQMPTGRDLKAVGAPDMGAPALGFMNFLLSLSDRGGLPPSLAGDISGSRLPALTLQQAMDAGLARLGPATRSFEYVLADFLRKCRMIVGSYDQDVPVNGWEFADQDTKTTGWAVIRAAECRKNRPITVTMKSDPLQDKIGRGIHADMMVKAGFWSLPTAIKESGRDDPNEEMAEIAADKVYKYAAELYARKRLMEDPELGELATMMFMGPMAAAAGAPEAMEPPGGEGGGGTGGQQAGVPAGPGGGTPAGLPTERRRGNSQGNRAALVGRG